MPVSLELGGIYSVKDAEYCKEKNLPLSVRIIEIDEEDSIAPFLGSDGCWYSKNGEIFGQDHSFDLVEFNGQL